MSTTGADDFIRKTAEARGQVTAADLTGLPREDLVPTARYLVEGGRLCRVKHTSGGAKIEPLCNFTARVSEGA